MAVREGEHSAAGYKGADDEYIGQPCRKGLQQNIAYKAALNPVLVGLQREKESGGTYGEHADQGNLGRLQRVGDGRYGCKQRHKQGKYIFHQK